MLPPGCKAGYCSSKKQTACFGLVVGLRWRLSPKLPFGRPSITLLALLSALPAQEGRDSAPDAGTREQIICWWKRAQVCWLEGSSACFHQLKIWPCALLFSMWQGTGLPAQQGGVAQPLRGHLKGTKIYFSGHSGDLQGPWSSKAMTPPPADSGACSCTYVDIISGKSQRLLLIMLYLQPPTNTDATFPSERQILSLLSTLCSGQRVITWGSGNGRPRGTKRSLARRALSK